LKKIVVVKQDNKFNKKMKIAIPIIDVTENKYTLANGLSVTGFLCLFDVDKNAGRWVKTLDLAPDMGQLLYELERKAVGAIITSKIHPMALKVLVNKGFDVYQSGGETVGENIRLYNECKLKKFSYKKAMDFANICDSECSDCSTTTCDTKPQSH
jgi:predicted Fe-Mo cluster-binding NifX family protein